jgi:hypothetical protein
VVVLDLRSHVTHHHASRTLQCRNFAAECPTTIGNFLRIYESTISTRLPSLRHALGVGDTVCSVVNHLHMSPHIIPWPRFGTPYYRQPLSRLVIWLVRDQITYLDIVHATIVPRISIEKFRVTGSSVVLTPKRERGGERGGNERNKDRRVILAIEPSPHIGRGRSVENEISNQPSSESGHDGHQ